MGRNESLRLLPLALCALLLHVACATAVELRGTPGDRVRCADRETVLDSNGHGVISVSTGTQDVELSVIDAAGDERTQRVARVPQPQWVELVAACTTATMMAMLVPVAFFAANPHVFGDAVATGAEAAAFGRPPPLPDGGGLQGLSWWTAPALAVALAASVTPLAWVALAEPPGVIQVESR